jgi:hypothetical protein
MSFSPKLLFIISWDVILHLNILLFVPKWRASLTDIFSDDVGEMTLLQIQVGV